MAIFGLAGIPRYELESDAANLITRDLPSMKVIERLEEMFDTPLTPYIAPVKSIEQACEWSVELRKLENVAAVTSAADFLGQNDENRAARMKAALGEGSSASSANTSLRSRIQKASEIGPITIASIPQEYAAGIVGKNGELAIRIILNEEVSDAHLITKDVDLIRSVAPTATGAALITRLAILGNQDFVPIIVPAIFIVVSLVLIVSFRNWRDVLFGLLPVTVGAAMTFGMCFWFGFQFDRLTGFIVPVILGLGVDDGIHVVERLRRYRVRTEANIHVAVEGVGRPIFLTTATTSVSFAGLLFTNHIPLEAMAKFMLVGLPLCFISSVMILPGAALIVERRRETAEEKAEAARIAAELP